MSSKMVQIMLYVAPELRIRLLRTGAHSEQAIPVKKCCRFRDRLLCAVVKYSAIQACKLRLLGISNAWRKICTQLIFVWFY